MLVSYAVAFCRWTIGIVFAWSLLAKLSNISSFTQTIRHFHLIPDGLIPLAAWSCLICEAFVFLMMLVGGQVLTWGFGIATLMLTVFCVALGSLLLRRIQTPCNCFGKSNRIVTKYEILRDVFFLLCALTGANISLVFQRQGYRLTWWDSSFAGGAAFVFVILVVQMKEILWVFQIPQP